MVANSPDRILQHPLTYESLVERGFKDPTEEAQEGQIPRYLIAITPYFRVTLVQQGLGSSEYQLHDISLDEGEEIYITDPKFPLIEQQVKTLESLLEVIGNPEKILKIIARTKGPEISIEHLESECEYLLGNY